MLLVVPGNKPWNLTAAFAGRDRTTSAVPRMQAFRICRAARLAFMDIPGSESLMLNHAYSASFFPLKLAFRGLPVLISPGQTVVTRILSLRSALRKPSENPVSANLPTL